jgi:hypothetical protein
MRLGGDGAWVEKRISPLRGRNDRGFGWSKENRQRQKAYAGVLRFAQNDSSYRYGLGWLLFGGWGEVFGEGDIQGLDAGYYGGGV